MFTKTLYIGSTEANFNIYFSLLTKKKPHKKKSYHFQCFQTRLSGDSSSTVFPARSFKHLSGGRLPSLGSFHSFLGPSP